LPNIVADAELNTNDRLDKIITAQLTGRSLFLLETAQTKRDNFSEKFEPIYNSFRGSSRFKITSKIAIFQKLTRLGEKSKNKKVVGCRLQQSHGLLLGSFQKSIEDATLAISDAERIEVSQQFAEIYTSSFLFYKKRVKAIVR
jgi:hypothetical protein